MLRGSRGFKSRPSLIVSSICYANETDVLNKIMYTVYVLKSLKDNRTYVGCTKNLENRIREHNSDEVESNKDRGPFSLWYKEDYADKLEAFKREKHFKSSWGRRQLRKILNNIQK